MKINLDSDKAIDIFDDHLLLTDGNDPAVMLKFGLDELPEIIEVLTGIRDRLAVRRQIEADRERLTEWNGE